MDRDRGDAAKGDRDRLKYEMPLFAHPFPPLANEQASGKPVGHHPDHGQKQDIRFGDDDPNASGLLKICVSPTRAALRPSVGKDFTY